MFNFFKRSKKESESGSSRRSKKDAGKEESPGRSFKDSGKNKLTSEKAENAPQGENVSLTSGIATTTTTGTVLRENACSPVTSDNVTTVTDTNDSKETNANPHDNNTNTNSERMSDRQQICEVTYPSATKKPEAIKETKAGSNVKPCGHGTLAISPRIPLPAVGKHDTGTPPESPKLEIKNKQNLLKKPSEIFEGAISVNATPLRHNERPEEALNDELNAAVPECVLEVRPEKFHDESPTPSAKEETPTANIHTEDDDMKNLINQEAKFQSQLNELSKQLSQRDAEASKLRFQMEELQRDVFAKSAGVDRLQAELQAAHKETEALRQKLKHLEEELREFKEKNAELADEINKKSETYTKYEFETKTKILELENVIKDLKVRIESLESQIEDLTSEKEKLEREHASILTDKEEQKKRVEVALEEALKQKEEIDKKWEQEFEKLRTVNILKEQQMLDDFEWKLREVEQMCKKKLQEKDRDIEERLQEACKDAGEKLILAEDMMKEVEHLKVYEAEVEKLRGLTQEQERSIQLMVEQQNQMQLAEQGLKNESKRLRNLIEMEKENLQHMQLVHNQQIADKERALRNTLEQKKTEIAMYWEERLLHECGRLKSELEQLHNEEKNFAMNVVRKQKDEELCEAKKKWDLKLQEALKEITALKHALVRKEQHYRNEISAQQSKTDQDILELRRLMDKIDMTHHNNFEKLMQTHEEELERINEENEQKLKEIESTWQNQVYTLRTTLELVKEQMERESQQKIQNLIDQHRSELDTQWANLIHQKSEAIKLVEIEYVSKYNTLEEQFYTQQKSHEAREVELLKTIDSLKNEISTKDSTIDDLQNNVDTLEGGIQVLNQEIAQQGDQLLKVKRDSDYKIRGLQEALTNLQAQLEKEREEFQNQLTQLQKQSETTIDHLQKKCQCLSKLFEEVRARYERRESRQEDLNTISDLRQVIAEQEKDLTCMNEEKRYYQMKLMSLQRSVEDEEEDFVDTEDFDSPDYVKHKDTNSKLSPSAILPNGYPPQLPNQPHSSLSIPPTIPECDDYDDV